MGKRRAPGKTLETKVYGLEPVYKETEEEVFLLPIYNWYTTMANESELAKWLREWMKDNGYTADEIGIVKKSKNVGRIGYLARMSSRGFPVPDRDISDIKEAIGVYISVDTKRQEAEQTSTTKNIQDYLNDYVNDILADLEPVYDEIIDTGKLPAKFDLHRDVLNQTKFKAVHAKKIALELEPRVAELKAAAVVHGNHVDEELREAWGHITLKQLKATIKIIEQIITECNEWAGYNKPKRTQRKAPVKVSVEKQVVRLKFKEQDSDFKIQSIDPRKIVGSQMVFAFNTQYRQLMVFETESVDGIKVSRSSLTEWDPKLSYKMKLRKPLDVLPTIVGKGKRAIVKMLDDLSTKRQPVKGRMNDKTVLLKVL